jgi:DNA-binding transcriptional MocR family regulator
LSSRRGSGYFVARQDLPATLLPAAMQATPNAIDALTPELYSGVSEALPVGAGWLPPEWYGEDTILDAVRQAMRIPANRLRGYGHPLGFPTLRQQMAATLGDELFPVEAEQILLTHGATHAFDLVLRTLTKPGDTVLVEDPGYSNLLSLIRHHGCMAVGIRAASTGSIWTRWRSRRRSISPSSCSSTPCCKIRSAPRSARRRRTACWPWPSSSTSGWWRTISTASWRRAARPRWRPWMACAA